MPVLTDPFPAIVFDARVGTLLPMDENLLAALLVLEPDFVESAAAHRAVRLHAAARLIRGQFVGGHGVGVVDAPEDDGPVRIPFQKSHDDLMADARNEYRAPLLARE